MSAEAGATSSDSAISCVAGSSPSSRATAASAVGAEGPVDIGVEGTQCRDRGRDADPDDEQRDEQRGS